MKIIAGILIVLAFALQNAGAQTLNWQWKHTEGGDSSTTFGTKIALDSRGNVFVLGEYSNRTIFSTDTLLSPPLDNDAYLAKYDNAGNFLWIKDLGAGSLAECLTIDRTDHIYIGGIYSDVTIFDSDTLHSKGGEDVFFAKYDNDGKMVWIKSSGGPGNDYPSDIGIDSSNTIYMTGTCADSALFRDTLINIKGMSRAGFLASYDTLGSLHWLRTINPTTPFGSVTPGDLCTDREGNIFITGSFSDTMQYKEGHLISKGKADMFLARFENTGNLVFIKTAGGPSDDYGTDICADKDNNIYVGGVFLLFAGNEIMDFDTTRIVSAGRENFFIAKYTTNGDLRWVKRGGSESQYYGDALVGMCADYESNIYFTGEIQPGITSFGNSAFVQGKGTGDLFIAKINSQGDLQWSVSAGGGNTDYGRDIVVDDQKNVYVTAQWNIAKENDILVGKFATKNLSVSTGDAHNNDNISLFPNPSSSSVSINYRLNKQCDVLFEIYDLLGRKIKQVSIGQMDAGEHSHTLDLHGFVNGTYVCRVSAEGRVESKVFTIVK